MAITLHARFQWIPLESISKGLATVDATNSFYGWRELVDTLKKQYPDRSHVVTPSHQLSAEVMYYSQGSLLARTARITRPSQFNLWDWTNDLDGAQGQYLWSVEDYIGPDGPSFASPAVSLPIAVHRGRHIVRRYFLMPGHPGQTPPFPGN
jgi:hypothetical protein